jgi:hypothetical protein
MSLTSYRAAPPRASANPFRICRDSVNRRRRFTLAAGATPKELSPVRRAPDLDPPAIPCISSSVVPESQKQKAACAARCFRQGRRCDEKISCVLQTWQRPTLPRLKTKYHRRWGVSRPCSEWERVQPPRHDHQVSEAQL